MPGTQGWNWGEDQNMFHRDEPQRLGADKDAENQLSCLLLSGPYLSAPNLWGYLIPQQKGLMESLAHLRLSCCSDLAVNSLTRRCPSVICSRDRLRFN